MWREGKVLLLRRPSRGEIRLPKGHIEPGESPEAAALREVREETGYQTLRIAADLGVRWVEFDYPDSGDRCQRQEHYFLMCLSDREREPLADGEAQFTRLWATIEEALEWLTFESERDVVRRAAEVLAGGAPCEAA